MKMKKVNADLIQAARTGDEMKLKALLVDPKCNPMSKDKNGKTALIWAAARTQGVCIKMLLPVSDPLAQDEKGMTALMWAAAHSRDSEGVSLLLPVSDACACDKRGISTLMLAAAFGNAAHVKILLPVSTVMSQSLDGMTASAYARVNTYHKLADFIDAHALAMSEKSDLCTWTEKCPTQRSGKLRV